MTLENEIFADVIVYGKYARFIGNEKRRETWEEICYRNMKMHIDKINNMDLNEEFSQATRHQSKNKLIKMIYNCYEKYVIPKKILPSMRSMQFAGKPIELSPNRVYNCAYMPIDSIHAFSEAMFLLLGGTGVGYSVQGHHVRELPHIIKPNPNRTYRYLIGDSIEGWAEAIRILFESYTGKRKTTPRFDYSDIRPKGTLLKTSGGRAPGPSPLRKCLVTMENSLLEMHDYHNILPIEAHDMLCHIADAVLAGGIRRAAMISLFSADDDDMLNCKVGMFYDENPQRMRANNSVVLLRHRIEKDKFDDLWDRVRMSGAGEPGIYFSNDKDWGTNPCCEIALRPYQFCNLTEVNVGNVESQEDLNARVEMGAFLGTLQASYTDFHYLREIWQKTTEKDALLGVSMTGIANKKTDLLNLEEAVECAKEMNKSVSETLGIKKASRVTCIKPAGTTSCVLGTSSGIHAWHSNYYIRTIRLNKQEDLCNYLEENLPELMEPDKFNSNQMIFSIPQRSPEGEDVITRNESAIEMLNRVKHFSERWVKPGHNSGLNSHNVSATVNIREHEWDVVREWMWEHRYVYNGLAVMPFDGGVYEQAPFQECDRETYDKYLEYLREIDLSKIIEDVDNTNLQGELACAGGSCDV